jgi:hypothetical protein
MMTMETYEAEAPRRFNPIRWLIKSILHFFVKTTILITRGIKRYPLPALILIIVVVGSLFWLSSFVSSMPALGGATASAEGRPISIELYLKGQSEFDANLMWEAMSDELKTTMTQNGQTLESARQRMEQAKQRGTRVTGFKYVGGTGLNDGRSVHLYVVSATNGQDVQQVPYTFTLNKVGKIITIE